MAKMRDRLELSGKKRLVLFLISIALIVLGTAFAERSVAVTLGFVIIGGLVGLVASGGMIPDRRHPYLYLMRRGKPGENRNFDDVPMNPWDTIAPDGEETKKETK